MRNTKNTKTNDRCAHQRRILFIAAAVVFSTMLGCSKSLACEITDAWLYVGKNSTEAATSTRTRQYVCDALDPYGYRAKWECYGADRLDVEVFEGGSMVDGEYLIEGDQRQWCADVTNSMYLGQGIHRIWSRVKLHDYPYQTDTEITNECKIAIDADPDDDHTGWSVISLDPDKCPYGLWCPDPPSVHDTQTDNCDHTLEVKCVRSSLSSCWFEYQYDGFKIGRCPWEGAFNHFEYRYVVPQSWGRKRFVESQHNSWNDHHQPPERGPDSNNEACTGKYCWRLEKWDLLINTQTVQQWRTTLSSSWWSWYNWDETRGSVCDANSNNHPSHPN